MGTYSITKKNTITAIGTIPSDFYTKGDTTYSGDSDATALSGTTRYGVQFRVQIPQDYAVSLTKGCSYFKPYSGIFKCTSTYSDYRLTFGVDINGIQKGLTTTTCDSLYGYRLDWQKNNSVNANKVTPY
jgi:hypothetical protein